jgi:hypothetical protein
MFRWWSEWVEWVEDGWDFLSVCYFVWVCLHKMGFIRSRKDLLMRRVTQWTVQDVVRCCKWMPNSDPDWDGINCEILVDSRIRWITDEEGYIHLKWDEMFSFFVEYILHFNIVRIPELSPLMMISLKFDELDWEISTNPISCSPFCGIIPPFSCRLRLKAASALSLQQPASLKLLSF